MSSKEKTYFQDSWLENDDFKDWLVKANEKTKAKCKRCRKTFQLSNMGVQALISHATGKKHKDLSQKVATFFKVNQSSEKTDSSGSVQTKVSSSDASSEKSQRSIELTLTSADVAKAEIRWTLDSVLKGNSNNQNANISTLLNVMFPGHETIKLFSLGADKLRYSCNYGLAPYFRRILTEQIQKSEIYVISFDESLNDVNQKCQMDLMIRYWEEKDQSVKVRYLQSSYLGHSTSHDLLEHFSKSTESLDPSKMIQVSMDGPNVNLKFLKELSSTRSESEIPGLINIGTCSLHTINNALQTGAKKSGWNLKNTLKGTWQLFHDSSARRDDYETITGSVTFPKAFCSTRWTESKPAAERAITIWPNIEKMVSFWEKQPTSKRPKSKSYDNVKKAVNDPLTVVKLEFFAFIASILEPFLVTYQTDKPMLPFLYFDLKSLILSLMKLFIKPCIISEAKTGSQLCGIDLEKATNLIPLKNIGLGFAAEAKLKELKISDAVTSTQESSFRVETRTFLASLVGKMFEKIPLTSVVVKSASIFDPSIIIDHSCDKLEGSLKKVLHHLLSLKIISAPKCNKAVQEFLSFYKNVKSCRDKFENFSRSDDSLDSFIIGCFPS